jgi:WD40 repeat protein
MAFMAKPTRAKSKAMALARSVFISYSRKDGKPTADALRNLLKESCDVWLDTESIGGGASWSEAIEAGLNACDVLLAVLTPASYVSEICRAEQIWALDEGKRVIPVLAVANATVPVHLKSLNYRKYPEHQADLLADLVLAPPERKPRPLLYDTVPNLPQNHVVREKALSDLRNLVFMEGAGANIAVTALAGMGGIGKTVLATALCRDQVVQRAFPDGIAWITIGREWDGDFVTRMREVARALGDDLSGYDNKLACENRYRTILREKAALVVVDDVWNLEHLKPLLVDASRSRFLFTTRDSGIANAVTDRKYSANLLSETEARDLLAGWSGQDLPPEAQQMIEACGELAAAISQIGACLREASPAEWCDLVQALDRADISAIEDRLPTGQVSFFKSLAVSVQAIPQQMQERYLKLAVLLEDVPAPLVVLQTLWKATEAEARRAARYFVERSLATWEDGAGPARGVRLHDLQLDYVRARFSDQTALSLIHAALRLSANVVAPRPEEFASQMVGRLLPYEEFPAVAEFSKDIAAAAPTPWLKPLWPSLHPPGTGLIRTLSGHSDQVNAVALTADGRRAISASSDNTLNVWDLESGQVLRTVTGHSSWVTAVALTADGRRAVSASADHTLKVWDLESGQELRSLAGHEDSVNAVALTADERRAVSASADHTLKVWDPESGRVLRTLAGHLSPVLAVALTADGRRAISASADHTLRVWDLESTQQLLTLAGHSSRVNAVALTADGRRAVSASDDHTLKVWDLESGQELRTLAGHLSPVLAVALTADGRRAVSASRGKTLKVWDLESGQELRSLPGHSSRVNAVALTADGRRVVSASDDHTLKVWDLVVGRQPGSLAGHANSVREVALTADGRRAVSASSDSTLKVWDLDSGRELRTLAGHSNSVAAVALTADGRRAVSACDSTLTVWDVDSGQELRTLTGHSSYVNAVALTADGRRAVSASADHTLKVWDLDSGQELRTLAGHSSYVNAVALTADGRRAVSASADHTLKVWDLDSGQELHTLAGHSSYVNAVALAMDGRRAVSASADQTLKVWDLASDQVLRTLAGHLSFVHGVALTADGRRAVSASGDNTLKVWDLANGSVIANFTCDGVATCCAFAAADLILAGDSGGRLYLLKLET